MEDGEEQGERMADNEVVIVLKGDLKDLQVKIEGLKGELQEVGNKGSQAVDGLTSKFKSLAQAIGGAMVIRKFVNFLKESVVASEKQAKAEIFLARSLKNVKTEIGNNVEMLKELAKKYQELTGVGDETILGFAGMLSTFQLNSRQIAQLIPRILDMAKAFEMTTGRTADYNSIAIAVGKALQGQTGILARYGVVLDKQAIETDKFNGILKSLDDNFKGAAESAGKTFSGSLDKLKSDLGDIKEVIGKFVSEGLKPYVTFLSKIAKWVKTVAESFDTIHKYQDSAMARLEKAQKEVNRLIREGKTGTKEYRHALIALKLAKQQYNKELKEAVKKQREMNKAMKEGAKATKEMSTQLKLLPLDKYKTFEGAVIEMPDVVVPAFEYTADKVEESTERMGESMVNLSDLMADAVDNIMDMAQSLMEGEEYTIKDMVDDIGKLVASLGTYAVILASTGSTALASTGSKVVSKGWEMGTKAGVPNWLKWGTFMGLGGALVGWAIDHFQEGGIVEQPTLAMVGERGREYILPEGKLENLLRAVGMREQTIVVKLENLLSLEDERVRMQIYRAVSDYGGVIGEVQG